MLLIAGLFINILNCLPHSILLSSGRTAILARLFWAELVPYLILVWILTEKFGTYGAAAAWSMRVIADASIQFYIAGKIIGRGVFAIISPTAFAVGGLLILASIIIGQIELFPVVRILVAFSVIAIFIAYSVGRIMTRAEVAVLVNRLNRRLFA